MEGGPGRRPSTGQVLEAITDCGAAEVVVLPNDADSVRVAEIAARTAESDEGMKVSVIPTNAQVQGLAALAVHEPGRTFEHDVLEMTATARHARHGAVTIAARQAITMAGPCEPGDVLGVIDGDFAVVGDDLETVATDVLERLLARRRGAGHHRRVAPTTATDWPPGAPPSSRSVTRMSTSWCTTVARSATRSSCPSSDPEPRQMISVDSPIAAVLGDQSAKRKKIEDGLGLRTVGDLLDHFPRRYVKTGELTKVDELEPGQMLTVIGEIVDSQIRTYTDRRSGRPRLPGRDSPLDRRSRRSG